MRRPCAAACRSVSSSTASLRHRRLALASAVLCAIVSPPSLAAPPPSFRPAQVPRVDPGSMPTAGPGVTEQLALTISLNQIETGQVLQVMRRDGRWLIAREEFERLPLQPPEGWDALPDPVPLDRELGFDVEFNSNDQRMALTAPVSWLSHRLTEMSARPDGPTNVPLSGPAGLVFNYDLAVSQGFDLSDHRGNSSQFAAATEWRWFDRGTGALSHTQFNRVDRSLDDGRWQASSVRLETRWQEAHPDRAVRWQIGDGVTDAGTGMRPIRFGGIKIGSDFDLQPYRTTSVLPTWFGSVALPSTVDLYIDGMRRYHGQVPPGSVSLDAVPGITGSGQATIVVTDILGRTQTYDFPFYATARLLLPGIASWSMSAGVVRLGYGLASNQYGGTLLANGRVRYGILRSLTAEASFEATEGVRTLGFMAHWAPGRLGVLTPRFSFSDASATDRDDYFGGSQLGLGYEWSSRNFSLNADTSRSTSGYRDIAGLYGGQWPRRTHRVGMGWSLGGAGSIGLSWVSQAEHGGFVGRYVSANWYRSLGHDWGLQVSLSHARAARNETLATIGLTHVLGYRRSANVSHALRSGEGDATTVSLSQAMTADSRQSWRVQARSGPGDPTVQLDATQEWALTRGQGQLNVRGSQVSGWAGLQGAVAWIDGHRIAARTIPDAFGLVTTDGIANVPVRLENRLIGLTDARGLLVTPLYGWIANRISVDALDLPADLGIDVAQQQVVGRGQAGSVIRFPMRRVRAATLALIDDLGEPVPVGSRVRLLSSVQVGPLVMPGLEDEDALYTTEVGYDGEVWLEKLAPLGNLLEVRLSRRRRCIARFDFPVDAVSPARIGPIACRGQAAPEDT